MMLLSKQTADKNVVSIPVALSTIDCVKTSRLSVKSRNFSLNLSTLTDCAMSKYSQTT